MLLPSPPTLSLSDYDYVLPPECIAQTPLASRDASRLLVLGRRDGHMEHRQFTDLPEYLNAGDVLVLNDTRVSALRLFGERAGHTGERTETFLTHRVTPTLWHALVRPGKKLLPGTTVDYGGGLRGTIGERTDDRGGRVVTLSAEEGQNIDALLAARGTAPLPPYITTPLPAESRERYQTVYAHAEGSAAAPTAGLHFTPELLARIEAQGVHIARVTLHVGLGTFRPIETEDVAAHVMHRERFEVTPDAAEIINGATGKIVAVGTTSARTLESAAVSPRRVAATAGETGLFVTPGYAFQMVDALVTNFHMPRSTLLLLVSALAGADNIRRAYAEALAAEYRFLSFGDAMLIL